MVNNKIEELLDRVKKISYAELHNHGFLQIAPDGNFVCPFCGNGTGTDGTGIKENIEPDGTRTAHCFKCADGDKIDNIKILANHYNLNWQDKADFIEIIKRGAKEFFNEELTNEIETEYIDMVAVRELILKDITESQKNLADFIEEHGGKWRGLTLATLNFLRFGYLAHWMHPLNIVRNKKVPTSRRIIVQTGEENYNAIMLSEDREGVSKNYWKLNAGHKKIFALDLLPDDLELIVFVEGEVDAASIYQATGGNVFALAIGGTKPSKECWIDLLNHFEGKHKPRVLVLLDNDAAGKNAVKKLCDKLISKDFPAVSKFLVEGTDKLDANDILQRQGDERLAEIVNKIIADSQADFESVEKQIEVTNSAFEPESDIKMTDELRTIIYCPDATDLDNGRRLVAIFYNTVKYLTDIDRWAFWNKDKNIWEIQASGKNSLALFMAKKAADFIAANAIGDKQKARAIPFRQHKKAAPALNYYRAFEETNATSRDFDKNQWWLAVKNGVINLKTGDLLPYSPEMMITKQCPVEYKGLDYKSDNDKFDKFDKFMKDILPDEPDIKPEKNTRAAVLRFLGYCLTGDVSEEKALFIVGNGRNGKGTLMKIISTILGDFATSINIDAFLEQKFSNGNSATPEFAKLDGRRFAVADEIPQGKNLDVAKLKGLTGGDKFSARNLHENPILIEPTTKFVFSGQYLPKFQNTYDIGYSERLLVAKFPNQFTGDKCNPKL